MRKANLRLRWDAGRLCVANEGPARARGVGVEAVGVYDGGQLPQLLGAVQPVDIEAGENTEWAVPTSKDVAADIECQLAWEDEDGPRTERRRVRRA